MTYLDSAAKKLLSGYPQFDDGRVDYTRERVCYALNCTVFCNNEILLTRRSAKVIAYPGTLNGVSGFIDRLDLPIEEMTQNELAEELDQTADKVIVGKMIIQIDESINREWRVYPVLAIFNKKFTPKTNWENTSAEWYDINEIKTLNLMPGSREAMTEALSLIKTKGK
jgi:hypothetical protein